MAIPLEKQSPVSEDSLNEKEDLRLVRESVEELKEIVDQDPELFDPQKSAKNKKENEFIKSGINDAEQEIDKDPGMFGHRYTKKHDRKKRIKFVEDTDDEIAEEVAKDPDMFGNVKEENLEEVIESDPGMFGKSSAKKAEKIDQPDSEAVFRPKPRPEKAEKVNEYQRLLEKRANLKEMSVNQKIIGALDPNEVVENYIAVPEGWSEDLPDDKKRELLRKTINFELDNINEFIDHVKGSDMGKIRKQEIKAEDLPELKLLLKRRASLKQYVANPKLLKVEDPENVIINYVSKPLNWGNLGIADKRETLQDSINEQLELMNIVIEQIRVGQRADVAEAKRTIRSRFADDIASGDYSLSTADERMGAVREALHVREQNIQKQEKKGFFNRVFGRLFKRK